MATWEPDIDPFDHGERGDEDYKWDDTFTHNLETRLNKLRQFSTTLDESRDETLIDIAMKTQPTIVYSEFPIKENGFSRRQSSSQYNKRST